MLVSVIIPTFNRREFVRDAIKSVLEQKYKGYELIVVDDGSNDKTEDLVQCYFKRDNNVFYHRIENSGVSKARNFGINEAKGKYIAFLDSDDLWLPGKLEKQIEFFRKNPDIAICQTEEIWIRNGRRVNPRHIHKKYSGDIFEQSLPRCIVSPSAVMINRDLFDKVGFFDEAMPVCEDYDLWLRISLNYQIITLDEPLIIKRGGHNDQLSRKRGLDIWRIYSLEKLLANKNLSDERKGIVINDIIRRAKIVANGAKKRGNHALADTFLRKLNNYSSLLGNL